MAAAHDLDTADGLNWRENTQTVTERADADFVERGGAVKACCSDESSRKTMSFNILYVPKATLDWRVKNLAYFFVMSGRDAAKMPYTPLG